MLRFPPLPSGPRVERLNLRSDKGWLIRTGLDRVYLLSAGLAHLAILAICPLIAAQISLNIVARLGGAEWSYTIPFYADFAGYFLSTASFMALAPTMRLGGHIRVGPLVQRLPLLLCWAAELGTLVLGAFLQDLPASTRPV